MHHVLATLILPLLAAPQDAIAPPSSLASVPQSKADEKGPTDADLVAAWKGLSEKDRADTIEWFIAECDNATHFRAGLERYVLVQAEGDPYSWPAATEPPRFDTNTHTPAQIIPRRFVSDTSQRHAKEAAKLLGPWNKREPDVAFRYDWAKGTIVALQDWQDPERIARTAAAGFSPVSDLVEALVEMQLDQGDMLEEAAAFGHAYSDRSGNAYRLVTLYDAWSSGHEIEMPDVECLGIIHTLEDNWKTWKAPVPGGQQKRLYDRIGTHFAPLRRYRALRVSLARTYVQGSPALPSGYEASTVRLHSFWETQASEAAKMADFLPTEKKWERWWKTEAKKVDRDKKVRPRAESRMRSLDESRAWTRRTFHGILREYGAFGE